MFKMLCHTLINTLICSACYNIYVESSNETYDKQITYDEDAQCNLLQQEPAAKEYSLREYLDQCRNTLDVEKKIKENILKTSENVKNLTQSEKPSEEPTKLAKTSEKQNKIDAKPENTTHSTPNCTTKLIKQQKAETKTEYEYANTTSRKYVFNENGKKYNEIALYIAGLIDHNDEQYRDFLKFMNNGWNTLSENSLNFIDTWTQKNISPSFYQLKTAINCLFYPFGGPDASYAIKFFPNVNTYILLGLEALGTCKHLDNIRNNKQSLKIIRQAFSSFLNKGYYITSEMSNHLYHESCKGTLPLILIAIAKLGFTIDSITEHHINQDGSLQEAHSDNAVNCNRIKFYKYENGAIIKKQLFYIRVDLTNTNRYINGIFNFVSTYNFVTLLKSASYILHNNAFSKLRDFILKNTNAVLQDDTGVPFCKYDQKEWDIKLFGKYTEPTLNIFKNYKQASLVEAYKKYYQPIEIPFKIGYGYNQARPNLIFALKKFQQ